MQNDSQGSSAVLVVPAVAVFAILIRASFYVGLSPLLSYIFMVLGSGARSLMIARSLGPVIYGVSLGVAVLIGICAGYVTGALVVGRQVLSSVMTGALAWAGSACFGHVYSAVMMHKYAPQTHYKPPVSVANLIGGLVLWVATASLGGWLASIRRAGHIKE